MQTPYDWIAVAIFMATAYLLFRRITGSGLDDRGLLTYIPPALGCALGNHFGNEGQYIVALVLFVATLAYIWHVLKPFGDEE
jgi:hypothetical protein